MKERIVGKDMVHEFSSTSEFIAAAGPLSRADGSNWYSGESKERSVALATEGNPALVAGALELAEKIHCEIETSRQEWTPAPYGAYPIVPEYLMGSPTPMRCLSDVDSDRAPVRLFVDLTSSTTCSESDLRARGYAVAALVEVMSRTRPVELRYVIAIGCRDSSARIVTVRAGITPVTAALTCHHLSSSGFTRGLGHGWINRMVLNGISNDINWAWKVSGNNPAYAVKMRAILGLGDLDIFIRGAYGTERLGVEWVQRQLDELREKLEI